MTRKECIGYGIIILSALPIIVTYFLNIDKTSQRIMVDYWYLVIIPFVAIPIAGRITR